MLKPDTAACQAARKAQGVGRGVSLQQRMFDAFVKLAGTVLRAVLPPGTWSEQSSGRRGGAAALGRVRRGARASTDGLQPGGFCLGQPSALDAATHVLAATGSQGGAGRSGRRSMLPVGLAAALPLQDAGASSGSLARDAWLWTSVCAQAPPESQQGGTALADIALLPAGAVLSGFALQVRLGVSRPVLSCCLPGEALARAGPVTSGAVGLSSPQEVRSSRNTASTHQARAAMASISAATPEPRTSTGSAAPASAVPQPPPPQQQQQRKGRSNASRPTDPTQPASVALGPVMVGAAAGTMDPVGIDMPDMTETVRRLVQSTVDTLLGSKTPSDQPFSEAGLDSLGTGGGGASAWMMWD